MSDALPTRPLWCTRCDHPSPYGTCPQCGCTEMTTVHPEADCVYPGDRRHGMPVRLAEDVLIHPKPTPLDTPGGPMNDTPTAEAEALRAVLGEHRADGWACCCGQPLNDSIASWADHLLEQISPLLRCPIADPSGLPCRLFPGHDGEHGDGRGIVWTEQIATPESGSGS